MWYIGLLILNALTVYSWYWLTTLPNRGTGGLGNLVGPVILGLTTIVVDLVVLSIVIYKQF